MNKNSKNNNDCWNFVKIHISSCFMLYSNFQNRNVSAFVVSTSFNINGSSSVFFSSSFQPNWEGEARWNLTQRTERNHEMEKSYKILIYVENAVKKLLRREKANEERTKKHTNVFCKVSIGSSHAICFLDQKYSHTQFAVHTVINWVCLFAYACKVIFVWKLF